MMGTASCKRFQDATGRQLKTDKIRVQWLRWPYQELQPQLLAPGPGLFNNLMMEGIDTQIVHFKK